MAIKIPSKNIYQINNPKVIDNVIDKISVEQKVVTPNKEYYTSIFSLNIVDKPLFEKMQMLENQKDVVYNITGRYYGYVSLQTQYLKQYNIKISKNQRNEFVSKIYLGKDKDEKPQIKTTIFYTLKKYYLTADVSDDYKISNVRRKNSQPFEDVEGNGEIPQPTISTKVAIENVSVSEENFTNISNENVLVNEDKDYFYLEITVLCGIDFRTVKGSNLFGLSEEESIEEEYEPKSIQIDIYGDTIGIDLADGSITYGSGNKPYSLSGNELLQDSAKYNISNSIKITSKEKLDTGYYLHYFEITNGTILEQEYIVNGWAITPILDSETTGHFETYFGSPFNEGEEYEISKDFILITDFISSNVLNKYNKGKETATIRCSISDYYNESGEKVIDITTSNMSFRLHDEVIPYIYSANGEDVPMSKKQDGTRKVFEVVGSNIIYDGAVWQELTLQEK